MLNLFNNLPTTNLSDNATLQLPELVSLGISLEEMLADLEVEDECRELRRLQLQDEAVDIKNACNPYYN